MELLRNTNFDFISKYRTGFILSAVVIVIGIVFLAIHQGPNFGIDFRGGVKIQAKFNRVVSEAELQSKLAEIGYERATIQIDESRNEASISMGHRPEFQQQLIDIPIMADPGDATAMRLQVSSTVEKLHLLEVGETVELIDGNLRQRNEITALDTVADSNAVQLTFANPFGIDLSENAHIQIQASVGRILTDALLEGGNDWQALVGGVNVSEVLPSVGRDLKWAALWSVLWSIVILLAYISWRFEFRFAIGAIAALVHDVLITLGIFAVLSKEINLPTVAAFLTIIGYSLNDTIVVFDRIRENSQTLRGTDYTTVLNRSINQSLSRTVITSLTTLFVVLVIFIITTAGEEINTFALALIVGVLVGTYSSIFIASPIVYLWNRGQQPA
ncbi:MAG: protein translocase subunit SecF [Candidatus Poribacteria bacterium]|nr:protein translocase subunit SecF [Candidatus Poribacteria bacterium]